MSGTQGKPDTLFPVDADVTTIGGIRNESATTKADAEGERTPIATDKEGRIITSPSSAAPAGMATETTLADIEGDVDTIVATISSSRVAVNPISGQAGVAAGAGAVSATVQRMTLASDDPGVASLGVMDDWDESDRAKVNLIVGQAGVTAGAGNVDATTLRVSIAADDAALGEVENDIEALLTPAQATADALSSADVLVSRLIDVDESFDLVTATNDSRIVAIHAFNTHATNLRYLKIYNDEAPDENDTPVFTIPLTPGGGFTLSKISSFIFSTGIAVRATTGVADNDTGAPGANEVIVNIEYI